MDVLTPAPVRPRVAARGPSQPPPARPASLAELVNPLGPVGTHLPPEAAIEVYDRLRSTSDALNLLVGAPTEVLERLLATTCSPHHLAALGGVYLTSASTTCCRSGEEPKWRSSLGYPLPPPLRREVGRAGALFGRHRRERATIAILAQAAERPGGVNDLATVLRNGLADAEAVRYFIGQAVAARPAVLFDAVLVQSDLPSELQLDFIRGGFGAWGCSPPLDPGRDRRVRTFAVSHSS